MAKATGVKLNTEKRDAEVSIELERMGKEVAAQIMKSEPPKVDLPVRSLSNISFNEEKGLLELGKTLSKRSFMNVAHSRKFMQTMMVAAWVNKELVKEGITTSLRDMYYALKRTLPGTKENTVEEQTESDPIVVDIETMLDVLREEMHLNADVRGRVVGNVIIKDRGDTVDWSKLGSGGWSIPSNVENVALESVDADYILLIEKNAAFERLHEDKFWKKNNCILMTSQGQAARGVRRLASRLSQDHNIPLYIFSVDAAEPIITVDDDGWIHNSAIGEYVDSQIAGYGSIDAGIYERSAACTGSALEVTSEGKAETGRILNVVRHPVYEGLHEVVTEQGFSIRVSGSHSVMAFDNYRIVPKKASELRKGDLLLSPTRIPNNESVTEVDWLPLIKKRRPALLSSVVVAGNSIRWKASELRMPRKALANESLCRLLGYYAAEGHATGSEVCLSFGAHETGYIDDAARCISEVFGCKAYRHSPHPTEVQLKFGGKLASMLLSEVLRTGKGARNKQVPDLIFNVPNRMKKEFLRGYFRGDGSMRVRKKGCSLWANTASRKLAGDIVMLLLQLGGWAQIERKTQNDHVIKKTGQLVKGGECYHVVISNKQTLRLLQDIAADLNKAALPFIARKDNDKSSLHRSIPSSLLKPLQREIRLLTGRGIGPLVNTQKRIPLERLCELFSGIKSWKTAEKKTRVAEALLAGWKTATQVAEETGIAYGTVYRSLKRLKTAGVVGSKEGNGRVLWRTKAAQKTVTAEAIGRLKTLKNLADSGIALLPVKSIKPVAATNGFVYDVEVNPTHTFVGGTGPLLLHNTDGDAYGWYIYSVIKWGSMNLAHVSGRLSCPKAKFLGLTMTDIETYGLENYTIKAKDIDIKRAKELLDYPWFQKPEWQAEIKLMIKKEYKAELEALSSKGLRFITTTYLPDKIENKAFLP
jgi:DNA topoisomerase VI subunit A